MSATFNEKFHHVLSHQLRDYSKLWHHRREPSKDEYQKLTTKLSEVLHRPVSEEKVRTVVKNVRRHLQRPEKRLSRKTQELRYMRAAEVISKITEEKQFFKEEVTANAVGSEKFLEEYLEIVEEDYAGPSTSAPAAQIRENRRFIKATSLPPYSEFGVFIVLFSASVILKYSGKYLKQ
ncbi:hypothetical protein GQX74_013516 [Glossina fuscipes]|nr:hypothetical protein GQX74_013516 [Glossina fuscipes]